MNRRQIKKAVAAALDIYEGIFFALYRSAIHREYRKANQIAQQNLPLTAARY